MALIDGPIAIGAATANGSSASFFYAVRDGLIRLPPKRGAPSKWQGKLGLELVEAVEAYRVANPIIRKGAPKLMSLAKAIRALREQHQTNGVSIYRTIWRSGITRPRRPGVM